MEDRIKQLDLLIVGDTTLGPAVFEELRVAQRELGLLQGNRATCPFLRPHIVLRDQYETTKRAAETLAGAFEKIAVAALAEEALLAVLDLTKAEEEAARIEPGYSRLCVSSRLDALVNAEGFQFLEYNAESPAGVGDQMQLEKILFRLPALRHFLDANSHWLPQPHRALLLSDGARDLQSAARLPRQSLSRCARFDRAGGGHGADGAQRGGGGRPPASRHHPGVGRPLGAAAPDAGPSRPARRRHAAAGPLHG